MKRFVPGIGLAACVLVPSLLFLGRYTIGEAAVAPAGSDSPQHVWRSEVVADLGLEALPAYAGEAQALNTNADRPGLPLALAFVSAVTGVDARELVYVVPAVAAAAIATAAAALAGAIPRVPAWGTALVGVATGTSVHVAFAANGYLDQLLVEPLLLAAAAGALGAAAGGPGRALGAVCLLAGWIVHWQFAVSFTALLLLLALACLPASLRERREGRGFWATAAGRVGATVAGGAGLGAVALLAGTPGMPRPPSGLQHEGVERHLGDQIGLYRLPAGAAAAAIGAASLAAPGPEPGRRRAAWLLIPWALAPAAAALLYAAGRVVPVQRSLSFALAVPVLGALGGVALVRWLHGRWGAAAGAVGATLVAVALIASAWTGWDVWRTRMPWSEDPRLAEFQALAGYLEDAGRPAVIVVDKPGRTGSGDRHFGTVPVLRRLRAELPPRLVLRTTVYLGDPDRLLAGLPTLRPEVPGFDEISGETWRAVRRLLPHEPVIAILRSQFVGFDTTLRVHPEWARTPWAAIVSGPTPPPSFADPPSPEGPSPGSLIAHWAAAFGIVTFAGAGWAGRFGGGPLTVRAALAPATGLAVLVAVGLVFERLGIRIGDAGGVFVWIGVSFAGAVAAATRRPGSSS